MTVTPALMRASGFVRHQAQNETAVIYAKFVVGKADTLDKMSRQGHNGSDIYCKKLKTFLTDTGRPSHLLELPAKHQTRDVAKLTFYHIGRYINHVQARRRGENVFNSTPLRVIDRELSPLRLTWRPQPYRVLALG